MRILCIITATSCESILLFLFFLVFKALHCTIYIYKLQCFLKNNYDIKTKTQLLNSNVWLPLKKIFKPYVSNGQTSPQHKLWHNLVYIFATIFTKSKYLWGFMPVLVTWRSMECYLLTRLSYTCCSLEICPMSLL